MYVKVPSRVRRIIDRPKISEFDQYQKLGEKIRFMDFLTPSLAYLVYNLAFGKYICVQYESALGVNMGNWGEAIVFGLALLSFVLGVSSIIVGVMAASEANTGMREKVEYGFFGVSSLVLFCVFLYAMNAG